MLKCCSHFYGYISQGCAKYFSEKAAIHLKITIRDDDELLWWPQGVNAKAETVPAVLAHKAVQSQGDPPPAPINVLSRLVVCSESCHDGSILPARNGAALLTCLLIQTDRITARSAATKWTAANVNKHKLSRLFLVFLCQLISLCCSVIP